MGKSYDIEMTLDDYQKAAKKTAIYPRKDTIYGLVYCVLGAAGEAGEVANKMKKVLRDEQGILTDDMRNMLADEVGDTLWYLSQLAGELGLTLEQVAERNLDKLAARKRAGTLKGSGDKR